MTEHDDAGDVTARTLTALATGGDPFAIALTVADEEDRYHAYDRIRAIDPDMAPSAAGWVVVGRDACHELPRNRLLGKRPPEGFPQRSPKPAVLARAFDSMLNMDPPAHSRVRGLTSKAFTPKAIARLEAYVQEVTDDLLDRAADRGSMDVVTDLAQPIPIAAIGEILGVAVEERERLLSWADTLSRAMDPHVGASMIEECIGVSEEIEAYFLDIFEQRRAHPRDDMLQSMIDARDAGDRLSETELISNCRLILIAGFETTVNLIGNGTRALLDNPDQLALLLRRPDLIPNAIEEMLRFDTPGQMVPYVARGEVEHSGHVVQPGEVVHLFLGAGNRDPRVFDEPHRFDVTRANADQHVTFASGPHYCLGAALARLEARVAFATLLRRFGDLAPSGPAVLRSSAIIRGHTSVPVSFTPVASGGGEVAE